MSDVANDKLKQMEAVSVDRIAEISMKVREAVRAALPAPMEQFFTVMVPGKVINPGVSVFVVLSLTYNDTSRRTTSRVLMSTEIRLRRCCLQ